MIAGDGPRRILVVEDDAFFRALLVQRLREERFGEIVAAEDGEEALRAVAGCAPDLVLLDVELPGRSGISVLTTLKSDERWRDIPVIVISGVEDISSIVACIELGAEDYLNKPFNPVILRARISASLEKRRLRALEAQRVAQIVAAQKRAQDLLHVILPPAAAEELLEVGRVASKRHEEVAVLFCDIVGFTSHCESHDPETVVSQLQALVEAFEEIADARGLEKIKTIGDAFMATAGMLRPSENPLLAAIEGGLEMARIAPRTAGGWRVRAGVGYGALVSGVLGQQKFQFDVWGSVVNLAARVVECASPGAVAVPRTVCSPLLANFDWRPLGARALKGIGDVDLIECIGIGSPAAGHDAEAD
jgi:class 3 adenylate cyclase